MADWNDVRGIALALPETEEGKAWDMTTWKVRGKMFVWERPLRKADFEALGDAAPDGEILGARVEHLVAKEALIADEPGIYFTTPHFDGYAAVLVRLGEIPKTDLEELIVEAWFCRAPKRLAREYATEHGLLDPEE